MNPLKIYTADLIDPEAEIHYAFHKSIRNITIEHHHEFFEVFLITKGEVVHVINRKQEILSEGALVFIRPDDVHHYAKSGGRECELINIAFSHKTTLELFHYLGEGFLPARLLETPMPPRATLPKAEMNLVKTQLQELNTLPRANKAEIRTRLRVALVELFSKYFPVNKRLEKRAIPDWLDWLVNEMHKKENFARGLPKMLDLSRRTPEHLSRLFKKHLGVTPTQFVNELRLNYAANLLTSTDETITGIALDAGFGNLSHFYHLFKERFKQPPRDFRLANRKNVIPE
ncbi:MAG TPA: AraC family transcriptional regulator [bacterium]